MSTRKFAVIVVTTLTLGATILAGAPANAGTATATTIPSTQAPAQRPDARPAPVRAKRPALTAGQIAARDEFAKRTGLAADALDGPFHIVNFASGKCLTVYQALKTNEAPVVQFDCDTTYPYNEDWFAYWATATGWPQYRNRNSGLCLTVYHARTDNDAPAVQFDCDNTPPFNEDWYPDQGAANNQPKHLTNYNSSLCLAISGNSNNNEAPAVQFTCDNIWPFNDLWTLPLAH